MKKKKVIAYSLLGLSVVVFGVLLSKKIKKDKLEKEESEESEESEGEEGEESSSTSKEFSSKVVSVGKDVRAGISSLSYNTGNDRNVLTKMENLVTKLGGLTTKEKKDMTEWYNSQGYSSFGDLQIALQKLLSPLWYDRAERTMWWNS